MANKSASKKYILVSQQNRMRSSSFKSSVATSYKKILAATNEANFDLALKCFKDFEKIISRGVTKGILKKNTVSRRISRAYGKIKLARTQRIP